MTLRFSRPNLSDEVCDNTQTLGRWLAYSNDTTPQDEIDRILEGGRFDGQAAHQFFGAAIRPLLYLALERNEVSTVRAFIAAGASVDLALEDNVTPLQSAIIKTAYDCADALLEGGANLNARCTRSTVSVVIDNFMCTHDFLIDCQKQGQKTFDDWQENRLQPADLTPQHVMQMLNVWPLADVHAPVPRMEHLKAVFSDARWNAENAGHKADLIQHIQGLTPREQIYLMGGHARQILARQNEQGQLSR